MAERWTDRPLRLSFGGPLEWEAMLAYFRSRAIPGIEHVTDTAYRRTVMVDGRPGMIELTRSASDELLLRVHLPGWKGPIHIAERARRIFSLDAPVEEAAQHLSGDPILGPLIAARPGLRVPGTWDPFETGVRAIIGQQISVAGASTIIGRLAQRVGRPVAGLEEPALRHTFPAPSVLAEADLGSIGLPGVRAAAIGAFARAVEGGEVRLDRSVPLDELTAAIAAIRGLGPWTAQYIALRLGEPDAFPADDLGLRRAVARLRPDPTPRLAELAAAWSPWRATAAMHLWHAPATAATADTRPAASAWSRRSDSTR